MGLDFVEEFLERTGERIAEADAPDATEVVYVPVRGRIEELDEAQVREHAAGTSVEFLLNVRGASADFVSTLMERYPHDEARAVVRDWLSQAGGQIACPAEARQECFLHVASWRALLERTGFRTAPVEERWLAYAESGGPRERRGRRHVDRHQPLRRLATDRAAPRRSRLTVQAHTSAR